VPNKDSDHDLVIRALIKVGWRIVKEQYRIRHVTETEDTSMFIDLKIENGQQQVALIEIKGLAKSLIHDLMELVGQYQLYRVALDLIDDKTPIYVAISQYDYRRIISKAVGVELIHRFSIPLVIYDSKQEKIIQWIPQL
jgi:hypothetical protein